MKRDFSGTLGRAMTQVARLAPFGQLGTIGTAGAALITLADLGATFALAFAPGTDVEGQDEFGATDAFIQQCSGFAESISAGGWLRALPLSVLKAESGAEGAARQEALGAYGAMLLLASGILVIHCLECLNGFGVPNTGADFVDGSATFSRQIISILDGAASAEAWTGAGAGAYDGHNLEQRIRANKMAQADHAMAHYLHTQAELVEQGRYGLAGARLALIGAGGLIATLFAKFQASWGPDKLAWANALIRVTQAVVIAAAAAAIGVVLSVWGRSMDIKNEIQRQTHDFYQWIVADVREKVPSNAAGPCVFTAVAEVDVTGVADFAEIIAQESAAATKADSGAVASALLTLDRRGTPAGQAAQLSSYRYPVKQVGGQAPAPAGEEADGSARTTDMGRAPVWGAPRNVAVLDSAERPPFARVGGPMRQDGTRRPG